MWYDSMMECNKDGGKCFYMIRQFPSKLVWIRIYRIFRINHNVVVLIRKIIIIWCFHCQAFRRCVTHLRKEGYEVIFYDDHCAKNEDVLCNPVNPVNPDSKPDESRNYSLKVNITYQTKDYLPILRWKLGAQQPVVWIRIFRINHNVVGLSGTFLLHGTFIVRPPAAALRSGEKKGEK